VTARARPVRPWTVAQAEAYLASLEMFGMRFGLERMRRLMTALGSPQHTFDSIHVVGTNGKSSTTRMIAAILERHGLRTGTYLSPHLVSFSERLQVGEGDVSETAFAAAVARAAHAGALVNRTLTQAGDRVTQFEALTAAAYSELASRQVAVAVVEAGLGGRYDATNVLPSRVTVLTNVGLEHTRWLGPTVTDIAREKLAVLRPGSTLVVGADLCPEAAAVAQEVAVARGAALVWASEKQAHPGPAGAGDPPLAARGLFQRRNFALARAAAETYLAGGADPEVLDADAVAGAGAATRVPGRLEVVDTEPLVVFDGAHNPPGMRALLESLPEVVGERRLVAVVSILDDKDAASMLALLLSHCSAILFTAADTPRALSPATLASLARQLGGPRVEGEPGGEETGMAVEPQPVRALERARELARARGAAVLVTGSIHLIATLLRDGSPSPSPGP